jgi:hypothetical protein
VSTKYKIIKPIGHGAYGTLSLALLSPLVAVNPFVRSLCTPEHLLTLAVISYAITRFSLWCTLFLLPRRLCAGVVV